MEEELKGVSAVDLFCGIGGLTHGLIKAGVPVIAGIDIDATCKYAYEANNHNRFVHADVSTMTSHDIDSLYPEGDLKVLVGCAPCQPFSTYTQKNKDRINDKKWNLLYSFARIIRGVEPSIISMENVPQLSKHEPFEALLDTLERMKYKIAYKNVSCENYGVPQRRRRLVLLASKLGDISMIPPTHGPANYVTVKDAIGNIEKIDAGECSKIDPLHKARKMSPLNHQRIINSHPGGTWKDWDRKLMLKCHLKESGKTFLAVYGRMSWDKPSPTITTEFYNYGSGRFGHPEQNRALSMREGAILQSFPDHYVFIDPENQMSNDTIGTYIGNAVPVRLGEAIGNSIIKHIKDYRNDTIPGVMRNGDSKTKSGRPNSRRTKRCKIEISHEHELECSE